MKRPAFHLPAIRTLALTALLGSSGLVRANTESDVLNKASDLDNPASYGGGKLPAQTNDLTFTSATYQNTAFTVNSKALQLGTLDDLNATQALTITGLYGVTLYGGTDAVAGSGMGDLLYVANGANLSYGGTGGLALAASGNFDTAGAAQATVSAAVSGGYTLTKQGSGTLTLSGANTYTGGTTFAGGVLNVGSAGALGSTGTLSFTGGTLQYSAANQTDYSARLSQAANQTYNIDTNGQNVTFATALTSSGGSLTKQGLGTLALGGANSLNTSINGGTLAIGAGASIVGNMSVGGGGALVVSAGGSTVGQIEVNVGGTLAVSAGGSCSSSSSFFVDGGTLSLSGSTSQLTFSGRGGVVIGEVSAATVNQSGGTFTVNNNMEVDSGTYTLSGGTLNAGDVSVGSGSSGTFNQSGGTVTSSRYGLSLGDSVTSASATYNLSGGTLSVSTTDIGSYGTGIINQSGGTFTNSGTFYLGDGAGVTSTYTLSGASSQLSTGVMYIGNAGVGVFNQSGGTFTTNGNALYLGYYAPGGDPQGDANSSGTYTLSGGALTTGTAYVGYGGVGVFNQSGGTFATNGNGLVLGANAGSSGTYTLSGGTLTTARTQVSDNANTSTFTQTGGTHTTGTLSLTGYATSSVGTYNLNGGTLNVGTVTSGDNGVSGTSTFNFNGGTLQAGASDNPGAASNPTTFFSGLTTPNVQAGGARIDTNGFNVTVAQVLLHDTTAGALATDGGLTKLGAGTLTLTAANTYTGNTTVSGGTLSVAGDANLGAAGNGVFVLSGASLVFTGNAPLTGRTFNLVNGTVAPASGGSLTYTGATVKRRHPRRGQPDSRQRHDARRHPHHQRHDPEPERRHRRLQDVLLTGNSTFTQAAGAVLNTTGDFTANPQTTITVNGTVNAAGGSVSGGLTINGGGTINTAGGSAAPLYLDGSRGTTVNAGGQLNAASSTTIELGGLLVNNGAQTGTLDVNLGGVARGTGHFRHGQRGQRRHLRPQRARGRWEHHQRLVHHPPDGRGRPRPHGVRRPAAQRPAGQRQRPEPRAGQRQLLCLQRARRAGRRRGPDTTQRTSAGCSPSRQVRRRVTRSRSAWRH